uniref:Peptidase family M20/M25/M40 n=1 Tax=Megaviridae environmental sample TaxID=1737588 RepID=A0A5J6VJR7_9VIRU|nr:MAG: peptidase family M20/M25/M40 [Megaviridae environmental sample]
MLKEIRRDLHRIPEGSFEEFKTQAYICKKLEQWNLMAKKIARTGVMTEIGESNTCIIVLRSDMDALPIKEETGVEYTSQHEGYQHACGHDGHMAIMLGVAHALSVNPPTDKMVRLIFQPAEEHGSEYYPDGGARLMIEEGVLDNATEIYGLHLWNGLPSTVIGCKVGAIMASSDDIKITIVGKGGHAANPHLCVDATTVASSLINIINTIVSRDVNPQDIAVVTIGCVSSGTTSNAISSNAIILGTVRSYSVETRKYILKRIQEIVNGLAIAFAVSITLETHYEDSPVINSKPQVENVKKAAKRLNLQYKEETTMASEDFGFYLEKIPGCFFFLGSQDGNQLDHHHCKFNFDENVLDVGVKMFLELIK